MIAGKSVRPALLLSASSLVPLTESKDRISVFSFVTENRAALDVVEALDVSGIAVRGGELAARCGSAWV